jgi:hypothetical protein
MFLLAAVAVAISAVALKTACLPRRLAPFGFLLAASLAVFGLGYILLALGLASAVYASGLLLLAFVVGAGITLQRLRWVPRQPLARLVGSIDGCLATGAHPRPGIVSATR